MNRASQVLIIGLFLFGLLTPKSAAQLPKKHAIQSQHNPRSIQKGCSNNWAYIIPSTIQNGTAKAQFNISTPNKELNPNAFLSLSKPQISKVTSTSFDWWYFDAISTSNPSEALTVTLFSASASSFPWLDASESSVLIAYIWATFANGSTFSDYVPATLATVSGGAKAEDLTSGQWDGTGFRWVTPSDRFSTYEVIINSEEMGVNGTFKIESSLAPHLPCGIQSDMSTLEIIPNVGWTALVPDARGIVNLDIQGTSLNFQGRAYHDKNWSNRPFTSSVQSWYWGHGRIDNYSIVWFSAIGIDNQTYVSSYVARDGKVLVSSCDSTSLSVRPLGKPGTTGSRYPPMAGDMPDGFIVEFDLGKKEGLLRVGVRVVGEVAGDGEYYTRWTGTMLGMVAGDDVKMMADGVAVFEQFVLLE